jgi:hypothetical protein
MTPKRPEPDISASERPQMHALGPVQTSVISSGDTAASSPEERTYVWTGPYTVRPQESVMWK